MRNKSELKAFIEGNNGTALHKKNLEEITKQGGAKETDQMTVTLLHHQIAVFALASVKSVHPYSRGLLPGCSKKAIKRNRRNLPKYKSIESKPLFNF
jgi:hypothetical protein